MLLGAAGEAAAPWPQWVVLPVQLGALLLLLYLWLSGRLLRKEETERALAAERRAADDRVEGIRALAEARVAAAEAVTAELRLRVQALVIDRDAWRQAHSAEVEALQHAERASLELMQSSTVTIRLLEAVERMIATEHDPGT